MQTFFWSFPPYESVQPQSCSGAVEENLSEEFIDERINQERVDFPDPLEHLVGFYSHENPAEELKQATPNRARLFLRLPGQRAEEGPLKPSPKAQLFLSACERLEQTTSLYLQAEEARPPLALSPRKRASLPSPQHLLTQNTGAHCGPQPASCHLYTSPSPRDS